MWGLVQYVASPQRIQLRALLLILKHFGAQISARLHRGRRFGSTGAFG